IDVVVVALDRDHVAAVHGRRDDLGPFEVRRDEHEAAQPGPSRMGGDRVREVAGRRAGGGLETELERLRERDRRHAILERVRRVERVVLHPHLAEPESGGEAVGADQRREPGAEVDRVAPVDGQEVGVAPDARRPGCDLLAADGRPDGVVVVVDLERPEAPLASEDGRDLVLAAALPTSKILHIRHADAPFAVLRGAEGPPPLDALSSTSSGDPLIGDSSFRHWHLAFTCSSRWLPRLRWACPSAALDERVRVKRYYTPVGSLKPLASPA